MRSCADSIVERRSENRLNLLFPATVAWTCEGEEVLEHTSTFSISNNGAGILVSRAIPAGSRIKVTLDMGGLSGASWAEVRWSHPAEDRCRIGVKFQPD